MSNALYQDHSIVHSLGCVICCPIIHLQMQCDAHITRGIIYPPMILHYYIILVSMSRMVLGKTALITVQQHCVMVCDILPHTPPI